MIPIGKCTSCAVTVLILLAVGVNACSTHTPYIAPRPIPEPVPYVEWHHTTPVKLHDASPAVRLGAVDDELRSIHQTLLNDKKK